MRTVLAALALVLVAAAPAGAVPLYATDGSSLVRFDSATPGSVTTVPVTGLAAAETLVGIDVRPATGELEGVGTTSRLYTIDPQSGVASPVASGPFSPPLNGISFGIDFNPTVDRLRLVSNNEQNLRLNPNTGALAAADTPLNPVGSIVATAYTSNVPGATSTLLYAIDAAAGTLRLFTNPNAGTHIELGSLGLGAPLDPAIGLDVAATGTMFASARPGAVSRLYTVNPASGLAALIGTIGDGTVPVHSLAAAAPDQISFATAAVSGAEGSTPVLSVRRANPTGGAMVVSYAAAPGSADASDYGAIGGTVSWSAGDSADKTIALPLAADGAVEAAETFTVALSGPATPGVVVPPSTATVTIGDVPPSPATQPPPPPPVTPVLNAAPQLEISWLARQRLAAVLSRGLGVKVTASESCRLTADLLLDATTARRLKLARRLARVTGNLTAGKARTLRLRPDATARRKLRGRRNARLTTALSCVDAGGAKSRGGLRTATVRRR